MASVEMLPAGEQSKGISDADITCDCSMRCVTR